jgi:hypothetical protein
MFSLMAVRNQLKSVAAKKNIPNKKIDHELVASSGSPNVISFIMPEAP